MKSFWRLSWITYSTTNTGRSLGNSYAGIIDSGATLETVGAGLKVVQGLTLADSTLAINTTSRTGKAKSVGVAVALEGVDSLGNPVKMATELFKATANAPLPSADITPEEVAILKDQHLRSGALDQAIAQQEASVSRKTSELASLENDIESLYQELQRWEDAEKNRVQTLLKEDCVR